MAGFTSLLSRRFRSWQLALFLAPLFVALLNGCGNSCFLVVSNPGGTGNPPPLTCPPTQPKAALEMAVQSAAPCDPCSTWNHVQSIHLELQGMELHPKADPAGESSGWQELIPEFAANPRQLDLVNEGPQNPTVVGLTTISSGIYDVVRLRFTSAQGSTGNQGSSQNPCGGPGTNCVIMTDGRVQPLLLAGGGPDLRISVDMPREGLPFIPPDSESRLIIRLALGGPVLAPSEEGVQLLPVLTGSARLESVSAPGEP